MIKKLLTLLAMTSCASSFAVEYQSPRTLALGGAGRAAPMLNDAIYLNPSYASFVPIYSLAAGYNWFHNDKASGRNYNASIQDSRTEMFQAGIGFTKREQNAAVTIGASKSIVQGLSTGLGSKIIIDNVTNNMNTDFLFSASYLAGTWMYTSFIVDNLLETTNIKLRGLYRTFYAGFKFIPLHEIQIYFDPLYSPSYVGGNKAGYALGAEFAVMNDFYLRVGKFQDGEITYLNTRGQGFGLGVGYLGPKVNLAYAMNRVTSAHNGAGLTTSNSVEMTIYF